MLPALLLAAAASAQPNILFVTIDTLRADRIGAYGHEAAQTPVMDRLAREGVLVEDAVVHVPQTRPSHATIFTGRLPYEHGIRDNYSNPLAAGTKTLARILQSHGWDTAAYIGAYPVSRSSGLDQGFNVYDDPFEAKEATTREARTERRAGEVVERALEWLRKPRQRPFFAWLHLFDPHAPYEAPAPYRTRFAQNPYDGEVAYADAEIGRVIGWLETSALRSGTLVVLTSDHGEGLGEHGEDEHMFFVYDSTLRVPLVFSWPGVLPAGSRVGGQFRSVDLLATVLELAGLPAPETSGASRASVLRGGGAIPENESYAESLYAQIHFGLAPLRALRSRGWKYIETPRAELYRIAEDPAETENRLAPSAGVAEAMRGRLLGFDPRTGVAPERPDVDPQTAERLAALGYVDGAPSPASGAQAVDLKDRIGELQAYQRGMRRGLQLFQQRAYEQAVRVLDALARGETASFNVRYYLGRSLLQLRRFAEAIPHLQKSVEMAPMRGSLSGLASAPIYAYLIEAYAGAGRLADAMRTLDEAMKVAPSNVELLRARGNLLARQGDLPGARDALEQVSRQSAAEPRLHVDLSNVYRNLGVVSRALVEADTALRLDPSSADAHVAHGLALGASGREAEAGRAFREALRHEQDHPDALFYLAAVELRAGRARMAVPLLEKLVAQAADYPEAAATLALARRMSSGARRGPGPGSR